MADFFEIGVRPNKTCWEVYPKFLVQRSCDLMIRGGKFYAIWMEDLGRWSTDGQDAIDMIDRALSKYAEEHKNDLGPTVKVLYLRDAENKMINRWREFCNVQSEERYHELDSKLIFADNKISKRDYSTHRLGYSLVECPTPGYDKLMTTLYSEEERHKLEWAIGAVVTGDSKTIQKFLVLYGAAGTGKSTILNIIEMLFEGYCCAFEAKALGSANSNFSLEPFRNGPLVAIQHDGDLSGIEDNTRLNSLVSHEKMIVNEKHLKTYEMTFRAMLFMGTNKPVKITDGKSGLLRRLIDVSPTGNKLSKKEYNEAFNHIKEELGGIACHCRDIYLADPGFYDNYTPFEMLGASNDFYNFVAENYFVFKKNDGTTLKEAYSLYFEYAKDSNVLRPMSKTAFKEELKNYFNEFHERYSMGDDGDRKRNVYAGFRFQKFEEEEKVKPVLPDKKQSTTKPKSWLEFKDIPSIMDDQFAYCSAQYAELTENGDRPKYKWVNNNTKLKELDTSKLHYVKVPEQYITIDFDIPDDNGNKSFERNFEAASKWPPTYAELSKSGAGIHLEYIYPGDVTELANIYEPHVEIKVFTGGSALRRKLTKCNDIPIATLNETLPLKPKGVGMISKKVMKTERDLIAFIQKAIEVGVDANGKMVVMNFNHAHAPNVQFIYKKLEEAYECGLEYDVSALMPSVIKFAQNSHHQADACLRLVRNMHWKSDADSVINEEQRIAPERPIAFWDVEVFPNLFICCWKIKGKENPVIKMINPTPEEIQYLLDNFRLVGFNNRRYDNHIMYARASGYSNMALFKLSKSIITDGKGFFGEAYNASYTDIYDYASVKQSLKKWEIELGIHHQECGFNWDEEVPEEYWPMVADYCCNDVIATEATWDATDADFMAREILADIAGMTVNDTTNTLTTRLIFGKNRTPQDEFEYRNMAEFDENPVRVDGFDEWTVFRGDNGKPIFPGYSYKLGKSTYRNEEVGEGGYVYAEPGIHCNVALLDIASMHPHSIIAERLFGPRYTKIFEDLVLMRIYIKHKEFDKAKGLLGGALAKYLDDPSKAKKLAQALKIAINSVYGLTDAGFDNPFKPKGNVDNIVAKRGALFMVNLKHEVQKRGFTVAHIKTDSIKIPDATPEIIKFVMDYGKLYGYTFEHEAVYERMCLVNDAVYIAKFATEEHCKEMFGYAPEENVLEGGQWTATGTQFQVPFVFKTLFSKEPLTFADYCETKSVKTSLYLDFNEGLPDVTEAEEVWNLRHVQTNTKTTKRQEALLERYSSMSDESIQDIIATGHNRRFVGKVGWFAPVKEGTGGGTLVVDRNGNYYSATGATGYRWKEAEMLNLNTSEIDYGYFKAKADTAIDTINTVAASNCWFGGNFDWLINGEYTPPQYVEGEYGLMPDYPFEIPFA